MACGSLGTQGSKSRRGPRFSLHEGRTYAAGARSLKASLRSVLPLAWLDARSNRRVHRKRGRFHLWKTQYPHCELTGCSSCEPWNFSPNSRYVRLGHALFALSAMRSLYAFAPRLRGPLAAQAREGCAFRESADDLGGPLFDDPVVLDVAPCELDEVCSALGVRRAEVERERRGPHTVFVVEGPLSLDLWVRRRGHSLERLGETLECEPLVAIAERALSL